ncbi:cholecystokinin receptor type A-like [Mytilus trossulus]|uniref:cholecystokinin receptor type A-like n=1 Tax=Mytilus trossulus TaxID=6551 RepID=UPI00300646B2
MTKMSNLTYISNVTRNSTDTYIINVTRAINDTKASIIQNLNDNEAAVLLPVIVYVFILMSAGIFGNLIVLYVYKFRFRRSSSRAFILCLAILDLVTCLFGMPFHVIDMNFPYLFVWDVPCKVLYFLLSSTIHASTFILVLISIERYRKICLPFEKQISDIGTKAICTACIMGAFILSTPILFLYGVASFDTGVSNTTGYECYISNDFSESIFPLIYDVVTIILFVGSTSTLTVLYTRIGIKVWRKGTFQGNKTKCKNGKQASENSKQSQGEKVIETSFTNKTKQPNKHLVNTSNTFDEYSNILINSPKLRKDLSKKTETRMDIRRSSLRLKWPENKRSSFRKSFRASFFSGKSISEESSSESFTSTLERKSKFVREGIRMTNKFSKKQRRSLRITGMLSLITVVFVISFLPYLVISILNGLEENFWENMTNNKLLIYNFLLRTYFINNMANPIIYGFLDEKFRSEVRKMFKCC